MHVCFRPRPGSTWLDDVHYKIRLHFRDLLQLIEVPPGRVRAGDPQSFGLIFRFHCPPEVFRLHHFEKKDSQRRVWVRGDVEEEPERDWKRTTRFSFCTDPLILGRYFDFLLVVRNDDNGARSRRAQKLIDDLLHRSDWGHGEADYWATYKGRGPVAKELIQPACTEEQRRLWARSLPFSSPVLAGEDGRRGPCLPRASRP